jgi:hypothetical protein
MSDRAPGEPSVLAPAVAETILGWLWAHASDRG